MRRAVYGAMQLALVACIVGGLGFAGATGLAYWRGKAAGKAQATADRDTHWRGVVNTMERQHREAYDKARADADRESAALQQRATDAEDQLARESARVRALRGDLARAVHDADRMRDQLATVATGGVAADQDSVAACRARADALGRVLGEALRASEQCHLDAEDLAAGVRALRSAWPKSDQLTKEP